MPATSKPKSSLLWLWILLGVGAAGLLLAGVVALGAAAWLFRPTPAAGPLAPVATARPAPMPRNDFRKAVLGKTPAEVRQFAGPPNSTSDSGDTQFWHYNLMTVDPANGQTDADAQVVFSEGRVESVSFYR